LVFVQLRIARPDVSAGVTIQGIGTIHDGGRFAWLKDTR